MGLSRHAIRYNSIGLFLSESPGANPKPSSIHFFNRTQSTTLAIDVARQDIQQIGDEDFLDRKIVTEANTQLSFEYLLTDGYEEKTLGLNIASGGGSFPSGTIYHNLKEDKNAFLVIGEEPFDLTGYAHRPNGYSGTDAIGVGNCFITNYSISAGVGDIAKASVNMVGSNVRYSCVGSGAGGTGWISAMGNLGYVLTQLDGFANLQDGAKVKLEQSEGATHKGGVPIPSLNLAEGGTDVLGAPITYLGEDDDGNEVTKTLENPGTGLVFDPILYNSPVSAITPGGINVHLKNLNIGGPIISGDSQGTCTKGSANIQNFNISLPFAREDLYGIGSMHAYGRKMKYPQLGTISFSLLSSAFESGNFKDLFCDDEIYNIEIDLNNHCDYTCYPSSKHDGFMKFVINNAKLDGYSLGESIGSFATMDCNFSFGISRKNGFFMSGSFT
jgi:hypothetical protein